MRRIKNKQFSSFKKQQKLFENWRAFIERDRVEEEIDRIINYHEQRLLSEGKLNEGMMQGVFKLGKKYGLDKLMMIAALSTIGASTPAEAGFLEDVEKQVKDKIEMVHDAAEDIKNHLEGKGINLETSAEGDPVFNYGEKSTIEGELARLSSLKGQKFNKVDEGADGGIYESDKSLVAITVMDKGTMEFSAHMAEREANMLNSNKLVQFKEGTTITDTSDDEYEGQLETSEGTLEGARNVGKIRIGEDTYAVTAMPKAPATPGSAAVPVK